MGAFEQLFGSGRGEFEQNFQKMKMPELRNVEASIRYSGVAHRTPAKFENSVFTLKRKGMKFFRRHYVGEIVKTQQ